MLNVRMILGSLIVGSLLSPIGALSETYTVSSTSPTSSIMNEDTDGNFTVYMPSSLWTQSGGPVTRRYGTIRERRILPDGTVQSFSHNISSDSSRNYSGRLSGTTEFYELKHCYEYLNNPANDQCHISPVHLTIQSFSAPIQLTTTPSSPLAVDPDGGHVNCVGPQC